MKGLELARAYYEEAGRKMIHEQFSDLEHLIAVGLTGSGSECYGYDDEVSTDHDFEPGFCIFLPDETVVDEQRAFQLERAYGRLPDSFRGFERGKLLPVGGNRHGVFRLSDYLMEKTGSTDGSLTLRQWLLTPSYVLAEAVNGEIWRDDSDLITSIRKGLLEMPRDVLCKRLAGNLILMNQSGQYNYDRCLKHGEKASAQLAAVEFVRSAMETIFLINGRYMPYYKWSFRALKDLEVLSELAMPLEYLLTTDNEPETAEKKKQLIELVAAAVTGELTRKGLSDSDSDDLERQAYRVNEGIRDNDLRNMHIMAAI